ncbi:phage tail tube protein [Paenibacillus alvei]|uniref:Phage tail tube protein n=2 Tax=Paenibacillus TaxID=44249 RepID=A0AAP7A4I9_PAEAL|nr:MULTISPECIES: phage tail tube protein [Paenibacillus]MCY7484333.1 phage tail tube protein [Paenibacillus alvei]MCY9734630.1 phage tail tube protein [Paenibacillus alvei]MCY9755352.1 phage tail tube protein [Paenibacillus alvei]MCY9761244.1 phage tail tube protein [Paenibacillus alvei]MCY9765711.1 phage tail tube protein [Paenibacillus alvei]
MERELIGRNLSVQDDKGDPIQTIKEIEVTLKPETLDIVRARRMSKTKQIVGYEIPVKLVMSKLESRLRYRLLEQFKAGKTMFLDRITGSIEDMQTGNTERVLITGIHIHDDMDILIAKIDENKGIDITLSGTATDFDFVEKFPEYMA